MSEDKIISADDAILQERAKLLAELSDITKAADEITRLREENARLRRLVKTAYAEGYYDNTETEKTQDELEALWQESFAYKVILDGGNNG